MMEEFWKNEKEFNDRKQRQENTINKVAKEKIKKTVATSINTTGIGALSSFENEFGHLWGLGKDYTELTDKEKEMKERWLDAREEILERTATAVKLSFREIERCQIKSYEEKRNQIIIRNKNHEKR